MNDIKSFVLLKYKILTPNSSTWHLGETYPLEVRKNWAWRCAEDVEHLATTKKAKEVYRVARLYRDGKATREELTTFHNTCIADSASANYAVYVAVYAALAIDAHAKYAIVAADNAANAAAYVVRAINTDITTYAATHATKWNLYIDWLIEELCKYEGLKNE